jgi:hypothetical protein
MLPAAWQLEHLDAKPLTKLLGFRPRMTAITVYVAAAVLIAGRLRHFQRIESVSCMVDDLKSSVSAVWPFPKAISTA